jgi:tetratricopeptide (TPR) repeat protein
VLRGRYGRAQRWLRRAISLAGDALEERAWAHAELGVVLTDIGRHTEALEELGEALSLARRAGAGPVQTWALTFSGRSHLLCRRYGAAREALSAALAGEQPGTPDPLPGAVRLTATATGV